MLIIKMANFDYFPMFFSVTKLGQVVNAIEHNMFVSNASVEVVLLVVLVNAQTLKHQPLRESTLQRTDLEDGIHMELGWAHRGQVLLHSPSNDRTFDLLIRPKSIQILILSQHEEKIHKSKRID